MEIAEVSSDTTIVKASDTSEIPKAALCLAPYLDERLTLVGGK